MTLSTHPKRYHHRKPRCRSATKLWEPDPVTRPEGGLTSVRDKGEAAAYLASRWLGNGPSSPSASLPRSTPGTLVSLFPLPASQPNLSTHQTHRVTSINNTTCNCKSPAIETSLDGSCRQRLELHLPILPPACTLSSLRYTSITIQLANNLIR